MITMPLESNSSEVCQNSIFHIDGFTIHVFGMDADLLDKESLAQMVMLLSTDAVVRTGEIAITATAIPNLIDPIMLRIELNDTPFGNLLANKDSQTSKFHFGIQ